jgi:hypothetical protein
MKKVILDIAGSLCVMEAPVKLAGARFCAKKNKKECDPRPLRFSLLVYLSICRFFFIRFYVPFYFILFYHLDLFFFILLALYQYHE